MKLLILFVCVLISQQSVLSLTDEKVPIYETPEIRKNDSVKSLNFSLSDKISTLESLILINPLNLLQELEEDPMLEVTLSEASVSMG